ncbi:RNA-directed DNA polymerase from mobile element jockey [Trichonephila clavipes]|nr:RNA-directed DNA polymerase from mobile element jockey [Trichonephila clavipes]
MSQDIQLEDFATAPDTPFNAPLEPTTLSQESQKHGDRPSYLQSTYAFPNWKKFQDILTNSLPVGPMGLHYSTENKVNLFADSLESSFQENPEPYDDDFIDQVEEKIENYMDRNARRHTAPLTSPEEVMDIILNLNNKKAPGQDEIKNIALKSFPFNTITYITQIFNRSLQFNYFPKEWKHAQITVLPKPKKDTKFAENYRPS